MSRSRLRVSLLFPTLKLHFIQFFSTSAYSSFPSLMDDQGIEVSKNVERSCWRPLIFVFPLRSPVFHRASRYRNARFPAIPRSFRDELDRRRLTCDAFHRYRRERRYRSTVTWCIVSLPVARPDEKQRAFATREFTLQIFYGAVEEQLK